MTMATNPHTILHINTAPTMGTTPTMKDAAEEAPEPEPSTSASADTTKSPLLTAQTLTAPATLLPAETLAQKAKSSKTVSNADKPVITKIGPQTAVEYSSDVEEANDTTSSSDEDEGNQKVWSQSLFPHNSHELCSIITRGSFYDAMANSTMLYS